VAETYTESVFVALQSGTGIHCPVFNSAGFQLRAADDDDPGVIGDLELRRQCDYKGCDNYCDLIGLFCGIHSCKVPQCPKKVNSAKASACSFQYCPTHHKLLCTRAPGVCLAKF
jgi:hypothetical protein